MLRILRVALLGAACALPLLGAAFAPRPAAANTLTIAQPFDPADLFGTISSTNAAFPVLESLFFNNPRTGKIEPWLAEGYETISETEIRLKLRKGVRFTNGEPVDAIAAANSIKVFADPAVAPAYTVYATGIESAEAVDDRTVRLKLKRPNPVLDLMLAQILVLPPRYFAEVGAKAFGQKPIGTGPFKMTEWIKDNRLVMDRNPDYWGEAPRGITRLIWRAVPDDNARAAGLIAGEYDIAVNLSIASAVDIEQRSDLKLIAGDNSRNFQIVLSILPAHPGPLHDKRVRQALNYAIDKQSLIKNLFFGKASELNGQIVRPSQIGYDPAIKDYPYDLAKAKALLAEAGHANGFELNFRCPSNRYPQGLEVCEAISGMLAKVGVKTKLVLLESGEFLRQYIKRELQPMGLMGLGVLDDPGHAIAQYRSDWRFSYIQSPALDALIDASARETDLEKRAAVLRQAMRFLHDEAPVVFLFGGREFYGVGPRVENFVVSGNQRFFFYGVSLKGK